MVHFAFLILTVVHTPKVVCRFSRDWCAAIRCLCHVNFKKYL